MNINWFEVFAQMINFVVLLFVLQKLFYKPLIKAMDERQQSLAKIQEETAQKMMEADATITVYHEKLAAIEETAQQTLENAKKEAESAKNALMKTYRIQADEKRQTYLNELEDEKTRISDEMRRVLGKSAVKIAAHILHMTVDQSSEEKMFETFIGKIRALKSDSPELMHLTHQAKISLVSATELPMEKRQIFEEVLQEKMGAGLAISYLTDKELVAGHELKFETFTLHHNVRKYVEESEKKIMQTMEKNSQ
jgi:ATP synthase F0 subunit b